MRVAEHDIKQRVVQELEKLPPEKLGEVLDFVTFLSRHPTRDETYITVCFLPASSLDGLLGLVEWGGDAVANSERLYDGNP